jgi:hypothetical protein
MTDDVSRTGLTRRQVLGGLGAVGITSAGAGLGTTALFGDSEAVSAVATAGRLDLLLDYRTTYRPWLNLAATEPIVDGTVLFDPDESGSFVVGQAPDFRDGGTGGVLDGDLWARITERADACVFTNRADVRTEFNGSLLADFLGVEVDGTVGVDDGFLPGYVDGTEGVMFDLTDVKPKDEGEATVSIHVCDNAAYVGVRPEFASSTEGGVVEPESVGGFVDDDATGELANYLYVRVWRDDDCSNTYDEGEELLYRGSLAGFVDAVAAAGDGGPVEGLLLEGDDFEENACLAPGVHCVAFDWYLVCEGADFERPSDAAAGDTIGAELDAAGLPRDPNAVQTDTLTFRLAFDAVQCRHNMPTETGSFRTVTGAGFGKDDAGADGLVEPPALEGKIREGGSGFTLELNGAEQTENIDEGVAVPFELTYANSTATLVYEDPDGDRTLTAPGVPITDAVGVTVRGRRPDNFATVSDLRLVVPSSGIDTTIPGTLNPLDIDPADDFRPGEPVSYRAFLDVEGLSDGFTLSGEATLNYDANASDEIPAVYLFAGATGA